MYSKPGGGGFALPSQIEMLTLAIETSCDDTSLALVRRTGESFIVEKMLSYTQVATHQAYGGVVPEIASREHAQQILHVLFHMVAGDEITDNNFDIQAIQNESGDVLRSLDTEQTKAFFDAIDSISVTSTPGLPGSLSVGRSVAHMLSKLFDKPLIPVNHIHGHIVSLLLERKLDDIKLPMLVLTVSGGHNQLYLVKQKAPLSKGGEGGINETIGPFAIEKIGGTLDDAAGEAFDKVSRMIGGPYPGGPWISQQALKGKPRKDIQFTRIFLKSSEYNFSFSGMKSQVFRLLERFKKEEHELTDQDRADIALEFQESVVEVLAKKLVKAGIEYEAKTIAIAGGVSASQRRREAVEEYLATKADMKVKNEAGELEALDLTFLGAPTQRKYCTDNAAMIGVVGLLHQGIVISE